MEIATWCWRCNCAWVWPSSWCHSPNSKSKVATQSCTTRVGSGANEIPPLLISSRSGVDRSNLRTRVGVLELVPGASGCDRVSKGVVVAPSCQQRWSTLQIDSVCICCWRNNYVLIGFINVAMLGSIGTKPYCTKGLVLWTIGLVCCRFSPIGVECVCGCVGRGSWGSLNEVSFLDPPLGGPYVAPTTTQPQPTCDLDCA
jgi:hypothetical protein